VIARGHARAWRLMAGPDGVRPGLPCAELLAPVPMAAIAIVALNDWWWKPSGALPGWLTGKLSDVAGVIALPLVLTAALGLGLRGAARLGARVDWTLRRWKLAAAIAVTIAAVVATKLSPTIAAEVASWLGRDARIVADASDLLALPAVLLAWWQGRAAIARVPYGRVAWARERGVTPSEALADVRACSAAPTAIDAVAAAMERDQPVMIDDALARLRG